MEGYLLWWNAFWLVSSDSTRMVLNWSSLYRSQLCFGYNTLSAARFRVRSTTSRIKAWELVTWLRPRNGILFHATRSFAYLASISTASSSTSGILSWLDETRRINSCLECGLSYHQASFPAGEYSLFLYRYLCLLLYYLSNILYKWLKRHRI